MLVLFIINFVSQHQSHGVILSQQSAVSSQQSAVSSQQSAVSSQQSAVRAQRRWRAWWWL
ncbi:hypothetical protein D6U18_06005 [Lactiplantibacillus pentosus]|uniref:Uncharacterized protein n=1 Tax=Lactiplantibacillus pentosus TaxID=1589 RepID=A0ABD7IQR6_LACPE|nr:hypothetical protein D6U18_06005 [Lactiplantibacillus pentosus]